jgi:two-component system, response regulator
LSDQFSHVLLVDDEPDILRLLGFFIKKRAIKITEASNGQEALKILEENKDIDLILSDIAMPEMTGIEFLEQLRDNGNKTPFIFVSAYSKQQGILENRELEFFDFVVKPIKKDFINQVLDKTFDHFYKKN